MHSKVYGLKLISYKSKIILAVSNSIKNHLIANFHISENRLHVIHNFLDLEEAKILIPKLDVLKKYSLPNLKIIGFVGRFDFEEKGIDILLEAFRLIYEMRKDSILVFVGDGKNEVLIRQFQNNYNLPIFIIPSERDIYTFYNIFDMLIVPSRIETFGLVIIEAGAMKKPVIASRVDGIPEIIEDKHNGLLFHTENISELVSAIQRLLDNPDYSEMLGNNLYKKVISDFTVNKIISQYESCYHSLVSK